MTARGATARAEVAADLARLADEGVPGAAPADWWGLLEPSTTGPLVDLADPEARVPVSPSQLGSFEECPLHWFVDRFGGTAPTATMGLGTVLHAALEDAPDIDVESLWSVVEARWDELEFESPWIAEAERRRARSMTESLAAYLRDTVSDGRTLLGAESRFELDLPPARVRGSIDRVERLADGSVHIVDLKTGRVAPGRDAVQQHPQLASYQLALASGAVEAAGPDPAPGGASLLFVSHGVRGKPYREARQSVLDADGLTAFRTRVVEAAEGMAGAVFVARLDDHCEGRSGAPCRIHVVGQVTR